MAALALSGVTWEEWIRFFLPLFLIFASLSIVYLVITQLMHWTGPVDFQKMEKEGLFTVFLLSFLYDKPFTNR